MKLSEMIKVMEHFENRWYLMSYSYHRHSKTIIKLKGLYNDDNSR